jgi:undecaprenyl-phosphate 4-deoxy-4-formamido-L-arabinose transferase
MPHRYHQPLKLSVVVPVYRSERCLAALSTAIADALEPAGLDYELILVNDCSPDGSWRVIEQLCRKDPRVVGVDLRRNFGQDNAILTGMRLARGEFIVIMDDDLQHHPKYIPTLLEKAVDDEADVVYADFEVKRQKLWKNIGSWINGRIAELVIYKPRNVYLSPYKIVRKEVAEAIIGRADPTPYVDGLLYQCTSRISSVQVAHFPRYAGESNYNFWRALGVSARLIFSFSLRPLRMAVWTGFVLAAIGLVAAVVVIAYRLSSPEAFEPYAVGWASLMVTFLVVAGLQMMFLGILGEYVGRTYLRVSEKPQTCVREILNRDSVVEPISTVLHGG